MERERGQLSYLNTARGISILLVVIAHSLVPEIRRNIVYGTLFHWICSYNVPLFAVISGYLFAKGVDRYKERGLFTFTKQKFQAMIIPYLTVTIISYLGFTVAHQIPFFSRILSGAGYDMPEFWRSVYQILLCQGNMDRHMWFAYAMFFVLVLSYLFSGLIRRPIGIAVAGGLFILNYYIELPFAIYKIIFLWVFFTVACQVKLIDKLLKREYMIAILPIHVVTYVIRYSNVLVPYEVFDALLAIVVGFSGSILVMSLTKNFLHPSLDKFLNLLSKESFAIYLLHQPFIVSGMCGILLATTKIPHIAICVIATILGIVIPVFLSTRIIDKFEILRKLILGKFVVAKKSAGDRHA